MAQRGYSVRAWDNLLTDPDAGEGMRARIEHALVDPAPSLADAMRGAKLVVCASVSPAVRSDVAAMLVGGQQLLDLDAATPEAQLDALGFAYDPVARQASSRGELP